MSGGTPAEVEIRFNGQDITSLCSIKESSFTSRAGGIAPGDCTVVFRDVRQRWRFEKGKTLELYIGGVREWDGYLLTVGYNYWFGTHTANCEPCPHVTPRKLILRGADRNVLWTRRVLYNKADPTDPNQTIWPADTPDNEVLVDGMTTWLDQVDGLDYTSEIQHVGSPDPYVEFRVPGPTNYWGDLFREVAQSTGAIWYIDPDRNVVYTDVETPDAPFALSDRPTGAQQGYRDLEILADASLMINDAMIWGAGQGSDQMAFARVEDAASIAAHGRMQNTGGFRTNLYQQQSVERVANSIVYGSPSSKRGHKDDKVTAHFTVFEPGLRVAQKVSIESEVHGWSDVLPIRQIVIRFHNPEQAEYEVTAGHEIDEPWTTSEYYWPPLTKPEENPPVRECRFPVYEDSGDPLVYGSNGDFPEPDELMRTHLTRWNPNRDFRVTIESGDPFPNNKWYWMYITDQPGDDLYGTVWDECITEGDTRLDNIGESRDTRYQLWHEDKFWYTIGDTGLQDYGRYEWSWWTYWERWTAPVNTRWPGAGMYLHLEGIIHFTGGETTREGSLEAGGIGGANEGDLQPLPTHTILLQAPMAVKECHPARLDAPGLVIRELAHGESSPFTAVKYFKDNAGFHLGTMIWEPKNTMDHVPSAHAWTEITNFYWTLGRPSGGAVLIGGDGEDECIPVPLWGDYCGPTIELTPTMYRTPSPYSAGSTKVYVNGIHQRPGDDYEETDPSVGRFTFQSEPSGEVTACYVATGIWTPTLPDTSTALFVVPVAGSVSGIFGPQGELWPGAYWHGVYYDHFHNGVDFSVGSGTPVYAAAGGTVVFEDQAAGGTMIHIYHDFNGMRTTYAHLSGRVAPNYSTVTQGQLIAYSGASGEVTGAHLHWGVTINGSPEDPLAWADYSIYPPDMVR